MIVLTLTLALLSAPEQSEQQALFRAGSEAYRQGLAQKRAEMDKLEPTENEPARLIVTTSLDEAQVALDGQPPVPVPAALEVEPGPHKLTVQAPGYLTQEVETVAVAESVVALAVTLEPLPGRLSVQAPSGARVHVD